MIKYFRSTGPDGDTIVAFNPSSSNPVCTASAAHPYFNEIVTRLENNDESAFKYFDASGLVMGAFNQITDRVSFDGTNVLFDGSPVHTALSEHLLRVIQTGDKAGYKAVALFWEKLESNPSAYSREQAYNFLARHKFSITADGDIVVFKGVVADDNGNYASVAVSQVSGKPSAYVDGKPQPERSAVTQSIGSVVTMPRAEVVENPNKMCERGLHVATEGYAKSYGNTVLEVHVNPRDIVSVPNEHNAQKVRVCRYKVAGISQGTYNQPVLASNTQTWVGDVAYRP